MRTCTIPLPFQSYHSDVKGHANWGQFLPSRQLQLVHAEGDLWAAWVCDQHHERSCQLWVQPGHPGRYQGLHAWNPQVPPPSLHCLWHQLPLSCGGECLVVLHWPYFFLTIRRCLSFHRADSLCLAVSQRLVVFITWFACLSGNLCYDSVPDRSRNHTLQQSDQLTLLVDCMIPETEF